MGMRSGREKKPSVRMAVSPSSNSTVDTPKKLTRSGAVGAPSCFHCSAAEGCKDGFCCSIQANPPMGKTSNNATAIATR